MKQGSRRQPWQICSESDPHSLPATTGPSSHLSRKKRPGGCPVQALLGREAEHNPRSVPKPPFHPPTTSPWASHRPGPKIFPPRLADNFAFLSHNHSIDGFHGVRAEATCLSEMPPARHDRCATPLAPLTPLTVEGCPQPVTAVFSNMEGYT